jgi:hypothetical protein
MRQRERRRNRSAQVLPLAESRAPRAGSKSTAAHRHSFGAQAQSGSGSANVARASNPSPASVLPLAQFARSHSPRDCERCAHTLFATLSGQSHSKGSRLRAASASGSVVRQGLACRAIRGSRRGAGDPRAQQLSGSLVTDGAVRRGRIGCSVAPQAGNPTAWLLRRYRGATRATSFEQLRKRSGGSGLNRRVGRHDRGRAWLERAVTVIT